jgi:hypothetical protein
VKLLRCREVVGTIFDLLGRNEDDMTYSLGYVASRAPAFTAALVRSVDAEPGEPAAGVVELQKVDGDGRTDVEIRWPKQFHAVIEAKRGPYLPTEQQLRKYLPRLRDSEAKTLRLIAVTNAPRHYAEQALPKSLDGVTVHHLAWRDIRNLVRGARSGESHKNKHLLDEFDEYLTEILGMENIRSNMVYVVSLGDGGVWGVDFKEVVTRHHRYFFPTEGRYPKVPPNYIAFRYEGRLQSIHHVESYEIFDNPRRVFKQANEDKTSPHYLLKLGPAMHPPREVRTGPKIKMAMRVWCMLDLLFTCKTITEARDETQRRLGGDANEVDDDD